jgi:hypothetical protein
VSATREYSEIASFLEVKGGAVGQVKLNPVACQNPMSSINNTQPTAYIDVQPAHNTSEVQVLRVENKSMSRVAKEAATAKLAAENPMCALCCGCCCDDSDAKDKAAREGRPY